MRKVILLIGFLTVNLVAFAQNPSVIKKKINWDEKPFLYSPTETYTLEVLHFDGAMYNPDHPTLPVFSEQIRVNGFGKLKVEVLNVNYEPLEKSPSADDAFLSGKLNFSTSIIQERSSFFGNVHFIPVRKTGNNRYEKVVYIELRLIYESGPTVSSRGPTTVTSKLADGNIYKIGLATTGVHKMTYSFLKDELGIPIDNIDPRKIQLLGNGGGMLPRPVSDFRYDDLEENPIFISGEGDGAFNETDYILFYGEGADKWFFETETKEFFMQRNVFSNVNYYFIKIGAQNGQRLENVADLNATPEYTSTSFDDYAQFEEDKLNLLYEFSSTQGSGQEWFGDNFRIVRERSYPNLFTFPNIETGEPVSIASRFAGRSGSKSTFYLDVAGQTFDRSISQVNLSESLNRYCNAGIVSGEFFPNSESVSVNVRYPETSGVSEGWLDFIRVNVRRKLILTGNQLAFRDTRANEFSTVRFNVSNAGSSTLVWDISDPVHPKNQLFTLNGSNLSFTINNSGSGLKQYVAFNANTGLLTPSAVGKINNQNLHGIDNVDMVILYHRNFEGAAQKLADHRVDHSDLNVALVRIDELYNEFSSGRQDPTAVRDFSRMLLERNDQFRYLLLLGDGSFDYKNIIGLEESQRHHYIPTFETTESFDPIKSFPTDDYFALLSPGEGANLEGALDIAVGRLPVKSAGEANALVDKIIKYETSPDEMKDWRLRIAMVADDEDSGTHFSGADNIARFIEKNYPLFNVDKIYFDAFRQVSTPGGNRFPDVQTAINQNIFKGVLVMNYLGHGGSTGWAQERVLSTPDIISWNNEDRPVVLVTATCSFTGFDEPNYVTGGEHALLNTHGGAIALFTTVRAVYAHSNERLTDSLFRRLFKRIDGIYPPIGDILISSKNSNSADTTNINARKFALIGDPAMKISIPTYNILTTKINGQDINSANVDTLNALSKVTIEGFIGDENGQLMNNFNGRVYPTIYDKRDTLKTLGQDPKSPVRQFTLQKKILFKGAATVNNGKFEFTFVVPKDINYSFGAGKISYYAENGEIDAGGYSDDIIVGGSSDAAFNDDQGPVVEVFMNEEDFVRGGLTDENPILLAKLFDDNGINIVGNSIGHDLTATLDDNVQDIYTLNDFYEAELDDYTRGTVKFPLYEMEEGLHRIRVKAWDVANNSGEGDTEFIVASSEEVALEHVLNYPNPFTTCTWFEFDPNQPLGQLLDVQVRIFTVSGKLVKTLDKQVVVSGDRVSRRDDLKWDGTDDFGDQLARGVYLYKVRVGTTDLSGGFKSAESEFEKLVILK